MKTGILPLARSTFDVPFAEERLAAMLAALEDLGCELRGPRHLLLEPDAADATMEEVLATAPELVLVLVLQVTFTDAAFIVRLAGATDSPIAIWAPPEPRLGGRLRLNALCGLNLASHALGRLDRPFSYLYAEPENAGEALGAFRCWPETFTQYGGAVCGPVSMMGEARAPCACEADVHGAATLVLLQRLSGEAVFLVDLVDLDAADDSGVVWHCGQAPVSMADPEAQMRGTVHTNRKQALLYEFPLKPGRVTLFRLSQAFNAPKVVVAGGEMLRRPLAFAGTSGVVRFDRPAQAILKDIMDCGMEHHMAVAYGDHRETLASLAAALDLPLVELGNG